MLVGFILFGPDKAGNLAVLDHKKGRISGHVLITSVQVGEGNGNPLQFSCLENPRDREAMEGYSPWGHKELDTN